jgi:hypothetical protein
MNFLKKGPELKLSELKVPGFVQDLYYDLKDRHLLPLVALLIVAMVAAPIYFKDSGGSEGGSAATPGAAATGSSTAAGETLVVARSEPGLRDYRRRLRRYRALDPFAGGGAEEVGLEGTEASGAGPSAAAAAAPEASAEGTVTSGETISPVEVPAEVPSFPESSAGPTESSTPRTVTKTETRYATDTIDVRIVAVRQGSADAKKKAKPKAEVRRNLPELTMLPARKTPAATYMGLTNDGKKALFVVSSDVVSVFGEAKCVIGSQTCQLLALEPDLPETFVYGPQERTYRIELLKIDHSFAAKPRRASLGATKRGHGSGDEGGGGSASGGGEGPAERGE